MVSNWPPECRTTPFFRLAMLTTLRIVTMSTLATMVIVPSACFSFAHDSDFGHQSTLSHFPTVGPTSQISSSTILLLAVLECSIVRFGGGPQWHNTRCKSLSYSSNSSPVEACRQTYRQMVVISP
jgi:hypothetical protein